MYEWTLERLNELFGLVPLPGWKIDLPAAVAEICTEYKVLPRDFEEGLAFDPVILRRLAGRLTVGETYFLRDSYHFDRIIDHLLGIYQAEHSRPLIWSDGVSTGNGHSARLRHGFCGIIFLGSKDKNGNWTKPCASAWSFSRSLCRSALPSSAKAVWTAFYSGMLQSISIRFQPIEFMNNFFVF